jgi:hypothetical protein
VSQKRAQKKNLSLFVFLGLLGVGSAHAQDNFCGYQCPIEHFPKTVNLFNSIQEAGRHLPQVCDLSLSKLFNDQDSDLVVGARKLMAMTYGSCDVLSQPVRGYGYGKAQAIPPSALSFDGEKKQYLAEKDLILANHPYLATRLSSACGDVSFCSTKKPEELNACDAAACLVLEHPPLYQFSSSLRDHSVFEKIQKGETSALGMDDASFISEAMSMMGARIYPDQTIDVAQKHKGGLSNEEFWALGAKNAKGQNQDCFDRIAGEVGVKPGDLVVGSRSHIAMIDTVGKDPFGIETLRKRSFNELQLNLQEVMTEKGIVRSKMISQYNTDLLKRTKLADVLSGESKVDYDLQKAYLDEISIDACEHMLRKPEDYRVTIIHSSPRGGYVGIQREKIFPGLGDPQTLSSESSAFQMKVIADCVQTLRSDWLAQVPASNEKIRVALRAEPPFIAALKEREKNGNVAHILRLNSSYEGCKSGLGERPVFEASQCVRCCPTQTTYDRLVPDEPQEVVKW